MAHFVTQQWTEQRSLRVIAARNFGDRFLNFPELITSMPQFLPPKASVSREGLARRLASDGKRGDVGAAIVGRRGKSGQAIAIARSRSRFGMEPSLILASSKLVKGAKRLRPDRRRDVDPGRISLPNLSEGLKHSRESPESKMAETEGFEPSIPVTRYGSLAGSWFQPLTHVSASQPSAARGAL